ncbi:G protein pathway suppressor 2-like isoform X2 [Pomacea canaliculata]|uniref:G protein pathway suppressor 2-like isoform X2 n=1 Tax=Pomacea canaliculata TaxID=400727 RepID=UPI000D727B07|nr:G protein pathway suppressor 2-like isoform X2 [Pomacea canaliculata]
MNKASNIASSCKIQLRPSRMPALLERPKMTRTMYEALKRHIMNERAKIKQVQEQDALIEQMRTERELRKKKEEEEALTLEQTRDQIAQLERKLEQLRSEKHQVFLQLKKVLNQEEETRRRAQLKEQSEMVSLQQQAFTQHGLTPSGHTVMLQATHMSSRPTLYKPMVPPIPFQTGMKRTRSPSPPSSSSYQAYHSDPKYPYNPGKAAPSHMYVPHTTAADFKMGSYAQAQSSQSSYATQVSHSYVQQAQPSVTSFQAGQSVAGKYAAAGGQSAFSSYQSHYASHQPGIASSKAVAEGFSGYALQRMPQPGYHTAPHSASLQHQLEQAQKSGFPEEKYKQPPMRGMSGAQQGVLMTQALQMQQQSKGSIVTGIPGQAANNYQPSSTTSGYQTQPGRASYGGQPHNRFY